MILKRYTAVFIALLLMAVTDAQTPQEWRDSLRTLNDLIKQYPSSLDLRLCKAAVNIELGQWEYAAEEYSRVLEKDAKNLAALYYRAYVNTHLRHYDLAKYDYEQFLAVMPKHFEASVGLAMVKKRMGRKADALDEMNRIVQIFPDSTLAYVLRAGFEAEIGQVEPSLFDWDEAIRREPRNADFVASKVDVLIREKRFDEARDEMKRAFSRGIPRVALKEWLDKCPL